ncbi:MAG: SMC-Scp complex subunit ScpB [Clostridia bacterium]|nr:SMC-Scp complex subunit ScpB [Clostridia bacterium]
MEFSLKYVSYDKEYLVNALEAVLFAGGDPVPLERLAALFDITKVEVDIVASALESRLSKKDSSFELCRLGDMLQLCTKKEYADPVQKYLEIKRTTPISKAALEALSIVAYKQPVTKTYIEQVRGVDCSGIVSTLLQRELIEECGRLDAPGRPILYQTTPGFLRCFGLNSLDELPGENSVQLKLGQDEHVSAEGDENE